MLIKICDLLLISESINPIDTSYSLFTIFLGLDSEIFNPPLGIFVYNDAFI